MILKSYEINKVDLSKINVILLYGKNEGAKNEAINSLVKGQSESLSYDQNEVLEKQNILFENIYSQSLFAEKKTIIIKRVNDKFLKIIEEIDLNKISDTKIILQSESLEKKSKLRLKFEKDKNFICIAFYPDNDQTLIRLAIENLKQKRISLSTTLINTVINQCNGDRDILYNQLKKIEMYSKNRKIISEEKLSKLINLIDNKDITELVNYYLIKNKKKITSILNENNFTNEDCVSILRIFLNKIKRLLILSNNYKDNNNIELTISSAKPPIFWKEKEITKQQIIKWKSENLRELIYRLNELEHLLKKNMNNSIYLMTDFILEEKH